MDYPRFRLLAALPALMFAVFAPTDAMCGTSVDLGLQDPSSVGDTIRIGTVSVQAARPSAVSAGAVQGDIDLGVSSIAKLPGLMGTADPLRTLQLMPGVQTTGEVSGGLFVRGSSNAHNLVELNGAHIFNAMHLLGIFSVFNDDNLSTFSLHKSYIPPRYGGNIGSVLAARSLTDPPHRLSIAGEVGLIASNLTLGIPFDDYTGIYLSGRLSYDPLLRLIASPKKEMKLRYTMHDIGATLIHRSPGNDRLTVNFYRGRDKLSIDGLYGADGGIGWGNMAGSVTWEHPFRGPHSLSQTFWATYYDNGIEVDHSSIRLSMPSAITEAGYKAIAASRTGNVAWEYGLDYTFHRVELQHPVFDNYIFTTSTPIPLTSHEAGFFAEITFDILRVIRVRGGLRASLLIATGGGRVGKVWGAPEPRLNVTVRTGERSSISASANFQQQYVNQVTSSDTGFPTDFWMPTTSVVPPQRAWSFALGFSQRTRGGMWEFSAELYYKTLSGQMESMRGMISSFNARQDIYSGIVYGRGRNFGLEVMVNKKYGRFTGWLSYTLGWALRSFPDIEGGRWFPMSYERRHDLSLVAMFRIDDRWSISSGFVFATGNAYTPVLAMYMVGETPVNEYGAHNSARMPPYHRLDLAVTYDIPSKRLPGRLTLSVYNVYARKNPMAFYAYVGLDGANKSVTLERHLSSLYSIIPSISWSFRFNR